MTRTRPQRVRRLPLSGVLRVGRPSDIWFKPALSVVVAVAPPSLTLVAFGRLDLAMYAMAGSLCALYAHNRPYAARARTLAGVVLGMLGSLAVALVAASLATDAVVLVTVGALLAAAQKALCDATRLGPPGNVIFTFVSSAALFAPQSLAQVPAHLALAAAAGAWAWIVGMAPGLVRPHGPERRATAHALNAAAAYAEVARSEKVRFEKEVRSEKVRSEKVRSETVGSEVVGPEAVGSESRARAAAAVHTAWQALLSIGARSASRRTPERRTPERRTPERRTPERRTPERRTPQRRNLERRNPQRRNLERSALERLVVRAEIALAAPADTNPERLRAWARALRGTGPVPQVGDLGDAADELLGVEVERATPGRTLWRGLGPLAPIAVRTALGCALAGYVSLAIGVGRPYWALVTAASLYQANITLTWSRAVQRVVGSLAGVLVFAAVAPIAHLGPLALVLCCLAFNFGAEVLISRNYWLGTICVTPLALLVTEFARFERPGELITDRVLDTLVGALVGFVAAVAVTNRRAGDRIELALGAVERARAHAARTAADESAGPGTIESARRDLAATLVDLRATVDAAAGEWWQRALPEERVMHAEQSGHRTLAAMARRHGTHASRHGQHASEDARG